MQLLSEEEKNDRNLFPLTKVQHAIWISQQLHPMSGLFNIGGYAVIQGEIDRNALQQAIRALLKRNNALRIRMTTSSAGKDVLYFDENHSFEIPYYDYSESENAALDCENWIKENFKISANIEREFFTSALLKSAENRYFWYVKVHHLIADGFSLSLIFNQVTEIYTQLKNNQPDPSEPFYDFTKHLLEDQSYMGSVKYENDKAFWIDKFKHASDAFQFEKIPGIEASFFSSRKEIILKRAIYNEICEEAKSYGIADFHYFLSLFYTLIKKVFDQEDFVVGIPLLNRNGRISKNTVGAFLNILPITLSGTPEDNSLDIARKTKEEINACYRHSKFPMIDLLEALDTGKTVYNTLFSFEKNSYLSDFNGDSVSIHHMPRNEQLEDLSIHILDYNDSWDVRIIFDYKNHLFSEEQITNLTQQFLHLLENAVKNTLLPLKEILLKKNAKHAGIERLYSPTDNLLAHFESQVAKNPDNIAFEFENSAVSYSELDDLSNRIAHYLKKDYDLKQGDLVGVFLHRSEQLLPALIGILKAGCAYLPIDPELPDNRISYYITDSSLKLILSEESFRERLGLFDENILFLEDIKTIETVPCFESISSSLKANDLCYVIYTSGSTGTPKGVEITHGNVLNLLLDLQERIAISASDRFLATTTYSFDISVLELFLPLITGSTVVLASSDTSKDADSLKKMLLNHAISFMQATPSTWQMLLDNGWPGSKSLKILCGGEYLNPSLAERLIQASSDLWNMYGPTETTVWSTCNHIASKEDIGSIGIPIANTRIYLLNTHGQEVPDGFIGEICIGGAGLAKGYRNKLDLTAEKFIQSAFIDGEQLYRTGDFGKWENQQLYFSGRKDEQVKIRGHRVELGEIENVLTQFKFIQHAVVLSFTNERGENYLAAYIKSENQKILIGEIRGYLKTLLPEYMLPEYFIPVATFPLTNNGKIDKKQLPVPTSKNSLRSVEYCPPRSQEDEKLVAIWEELLGQSRIGITDDFFELGGHSLKAMRLKNSIHQTFGVNVELKELFTHTTVESLTDFILSSNKTDLDVFETAPKMERYPLSSSQRRLWILSQFTQSNIAYNMSGAYRFEGPLDRQKLNKSFELLQERHEILRTVFGEDSEGNPYQVILNESNFLLVYSDLRGLANNLEIVSKEISEESVTPFDLSKGPFLRAKLYELADQRYVLLFTMHHIISDGWSMNVLIEEVITNYANLTAGISTKPTPLRFHYKDYAYWQQSKLKTEAFLSSKSYWIDQLAGDLPILQLPFDHPRPAMKTYRGAQAALLLEPAWVSTLYELGASKGATLYMSLLAAVNALFYRYTGQHDILIGGPIAGREHADLENQIGYYVNTLVFRSRFSKEVSFSEILQESVAVALAAYEHQSYPFDELVDNLSIQRDLSRNALFDVMMVLQNLGDQEVVSKTLGQATILPYEGKDHPITKFDLTFHFTEQTSGLLLTIEYNTDLFESETIERMLTHFQQLVAAVCADPACPLNKVDYLSKDEKSVLINSFNPPEAVYPNSAITELFAQQVLKTPTNIALVHQEKSLSYEVLDALSTCFGWYLRSEYAVGSGDLVGIVLNRSEWQVIALLGVLKSGAAYVPIDPDSPAERIAYIQSDSGCKLMIDQKECERFESLQKNYSQTNIDLVNQPNDPAYVIYTSGTTGKPKGVVVDHSNVVNLVFWHQSHFLITENDRATLYAGVAFDASVWELFPYLLKGASVYIVPEEIRLDVISLNAFYENNKISISFLPTQFSRQFQEVDNQSLRYLLVGGDQLHDVSKTNYQVVNNYGPTENTVVTTSFTITDSTSSIPIGKPIANNRVFILDETLNLVPIGVQGEICVSGKSLAKGYFNQPELTAAKFVKHPYLKDQLLYKTGDLGKWLPDGNIEFLGRIDDQVKIRGYRIELGEIETVLQSHPDIAAGIVVAKTNLGKDKELVAFVVRNVQLATNEIRSYLAHQLPGYMIPSHFVLLDDIPLTSNGKADRNQLLELFDQSIDLQTANNVAPATETEIKLADVWEELLHKKISGIHQGFFEIGGHSLSAARLSTKIHQVFDVKLTLADLFIHTTIEQQAIFIQQATKTTFLAIPEVKSAANYELTASQKRLWVLSQIHDANVAYNMPGVYRFSGSINTESLDFAFRTLIARHESLRTIFKEDDQGEVKQFILTEEAIGFKIVKQDLKGVDFQETLLHDLIRSEFNTPFDLEKGPLIRAVLVQVEENEWIFSYVMHHIISDGWSMEIVIKELLLFYNMHQNNKVDSLTALRIHYKDFAAWQYEQLKKPELQIQKEYWLKQFEGELPVLDLPGDWVRPAIKTYHGKPYKTLINKQLTQELKKTSQETGATLFMSLLTLLNTLLYKYTRQTDIIIGSPVATRSHVELENQIGLYLNTLAFRTTFDEQDNFLQLLAQCKELTLKAYENQVFQFDELVDSLNLKRDLSRNALFEVMLVLQNTKLDTQTTPNVDFELSEYTGVDISMSRFDLVFNFEEVDEQLELTLVFNSDIYKQETIIQLANHFIQLSEQVIKVPDEPLNQLVFLAESEQRQLIHGFNDTKRAYRTELTLIQLFEEQVDKNPENIALILENRSFTYRELNEKANQLGDYLRKEYAALPNELIGVMLERSEWMIISILGVLKSGAAYLPIDPDYPSERLQYILDDSKAKVVINDQELDRFKNKMDHYSNQNPVPDTTSSDLAYVIYTSGSTGNPKGCMLEHRGVVNRIQWMWEQYGFTSKDVILQKTTFTFDVSVWEIFMPLCWGTKMILCHKNDIASPDRIVELIQKHQVTCLHFVPSMLDVFVTSLFTRDITERLSSLTKLITSGEALVPDLVKRWYEKIDTPIHNLYGPTEASIDVTHFTTSKEDRKIPIGKPIANTEIYILDAQNQLLPIGVAGEIMIAGDGLARGYLNKPEQTAEKFVPNPFNKGTLMYKTGDIGRWLADGNIEYLGRLDDQVKIRGYRIELGEIENVLHEHPAINSATVLVKETRENNKELVVYYVPDEQTNFTANAIVKSLQDDLNDGVELYELANGLSIYANNKSELQFLYDEIVEDRVYLKHGISIPDNACIVDVGANLGMFSIHSNTLAKNVTIYAFEPVPPIFNLLERNTSLYKGNFHLFNSGLSDKEEEVSFTYYQNATILSGRYAEETEVRDTVEKFIQNTERNQTDQISEEEIGALLNDRLISESYKCHLKTLSQVIHENEIHQIDLLKIDVEKAEMDVLNGIDENDWGKIKQIVLEIHDTEGRLNTIKQMLDARGFRVVVEQSAELEGTALYDVYAISTKIQSKAKVESTNSQEYVSWFGINKLKEQLKNYLKTKLPDYMIPAQFVPVKSITLNSNGKIDRKALLSIQEHRLTTSMDYIAPRNEIEEKIVQIWKDVLEVEKIGVNDNFFDLGGNSIKIVKMVGLLNKISAKKITVLTAFRFPNIQGLSEYIESDENLDIIDVKVVDEEMKETVTIMEETMNLLNQIEDEE